MRLQAGIAFIGLLLAMAIVGIVAGTAADVWQLTRQRQREAELLWIGDQIRAAIISYQQASPGQIRSFPVRLEDLLSDPRYPGIRRHLRRLYPDPMTGKPDWEIIPAPHGGIAGVRSRSTALPLKQDNFRPRDAHFQGRKRYADWDFSVLPPMPGGPLPIAIRPGAAGTDGQ